MRLATTDGATVLELHVTGYEFPHLHSEAYDSNWLNISIEVTDPRGGWSRTDPAMLTYEVRRLAEWLERVAGGDRSEPEEWFLEPNLTFEIAGSEEGERLRVTFNAEFLPPWRKGSTDDDLPYVELPLVEAELRACAAALRAELARYPQRAEV